MKEHIKVFMGFHSGRVKAFVLLGYGAVSLDECPAWWRHLQGSNSSLGIQPLKIKPPLCPKNNRHQSPSDMTPYPISKRP